MEPRSTAPAMRRAFIIVGMAATWLPLLDRLLFPVSFTYEHTGDTTAYLFNIVYHVLAIGIALAICLGARRGKTAWAENGRVVLGTGIGGALGIALVALFDFSSVAASVLVGAGVALAAFFLPIHFAFWSSRLAEADGDHAPQDAALSFLLISLLFALYATLGLNVVSLAAAGPALSGVLGYMSLRAHPATPSAGGEMALPLKASMFSVCLAFIVLCNVAVIYFNHDAHLQDDFSFRFAIPWGQAAVFAVVAFLYANRGGRRRATIAAFVLVSLMFVGALFLAIFMSRGALNVGTVPLNCANAVLIAFGWLLLVRYANRSEESPLFAVALYLALFALLPRFVQALFMYRDNFLTMFAQQVNYLYVVVGIAFLAVGLIVAALLLSFTGAHKGDPARSASDAPDAPAPAAAAEPPVDTRYLHDALRAERCDAVLEDLRESVGLSDREVEIARYALKNYSARKIAHDLFISENTVYSHLKHIYQKTDVHSKQEFIEYVEAQFTES